MHMCLHGCGNQGTTSGDHIPLVPSTLAFVIGHLSLTWSSTVHYESHAIPRIHLSLTPPHPQGYNRQQQHLAFSCGFWGIKFGSSCSWGKCFTDCSISVSSLQNIFHTQKSLWIVGKRHNLHTSSPRFDSIVWLRHADFNLIPFGSLQTLIDPLAPSS